jgi:hypothetical protein
MTINRRRPTALVRPTPDTQFSYLMAARSRASRIVDLKGNNRGSFIGAFVAWLDGKWQTLVFESRHELLTGYILLSTKGVEDLQDQPPLVRYIGLDGRWHAHTFDYLVIVNGKRYAVACKFASSVARLRFKHQLSTIRAQLNGFADDVLLVTEQDFSRERALAAELFHFMRREIDDEADAAVAAIVDTLSASTTIGDLVRAAGLNARGWRAIVRAVGEHRLQIVGKRRIDDYSTSVVRR